MKKLTTILTVLGASSLIAATESATIRVDTRQADIDGRIANGVEQVGEPDGSSSSAWNTTSKIWNGNAEYPDGYYVRGPEGWVPENETNATPESDVLVVNEKQVKGGRLAESETWTTDDAYLIRHNTILTNNIDLVIEPETEVAFAKEARLVVEGGTLTIKGAFLSDGFTSEAQDWIAGISETDYAHIMMLDGAEEVASMRSYTKGTVYGTLPTFDKYEEGWWFRGWKMDQESSESVKSDDEVSMSIDRLYCNWELIYLTPEKTSVELPAYSVGVTESVNIGSNDEWTFSKEAEWFEVSADTTISNGVLTITAEQNRSETPRSATIAISRKNGKLAQEITVSQPAMEHVATPLIATGSGDTTFADYVETIWITCATKGAKIYYTIDGSEPSPDNGAELVTYDYDEGIAGVINVYGTTTIKAMAIKYDLLDSATSTLGVVRADTLATAMDIPEIFVTTGGDKLWEVTTVGASDGVSCVKSGKMETTQTRRQSSRLEMVVEGSGVLTFKWRVDCERDLTGAANWDYLAFLADGTVQKKIEGNTSWQSVSITLTGDNYHILTWLYTKNAAKVDINPGEDCAWVDQVSWKPVVMVGEGENTRELYVDSSLLNGLGLVGASDAQLAAQATADADGDGFSNETELILGTDPFDKESNLSLKIEGFNAAGGLDVSYPINDQPNKNYALDYRLLGAKELGLGFEDVTNLSEEERAAYKFFKVNVKINGK